MMTTAAKTALTVGVALVAASCSSSTGGVAVTNGQPTDAFRSAVTELAGAITAGNAAELANLDSSGTDGSSIPILAARYHDLPVTAVGFDTLGTGSGAATYEVACSQGPHVTFIVGFASRNDTWTPALGIARATSTSPIPGVPAASNSQFTAPATAPSAAGQSTTELNQRYPRCPN